MIFAGGVGPDVLRFAERQTKGRLAVHTPAGRVRRVEFRHSQRLDRRFVGPRQVRHRRAGKTGAGARAEDFRRTQQLCRLAGWPEVAACQLSRLSRTYWVIRSSICRAIRSASTNLGFDAAASPAIIATWPRYMSMVWR